MILSIFFIVHLLADFFFQTSTMAMKKKREGKVLLLHAFIYFFMFLIAHLLVIDRSYFVFPLLTVSLLHLMIDVSKEKIEEKYSKKKNKGTVLFFFFLIDQGLHLLSILFIFYFFQLKNHGNTFYVLYQDSKNIHNGILYLLLFLTILSPAAIFIKKIFLLIPQKTMEKNESINVRIGSLIGQLERIIIVIFLLHEQYGAIGLVLTAKSIARFKQMDDKDFAEKYLVGTLSSLLIALVVTMIVKEYLI